MSLPREIIPGSFYMVNRSCTQQQFLLRPDALTNQLFLYCLIEAALRFGIDVILPSMMSNHHHTLIYDRHGTVSEFIGHFHKMLAKSMNAHRGRWENFWSSEPPCFVRLDDPADVIDKLVYAATNPVKDGLVARVHHWPGVNGLAALLSGRPIVVQRPRCFFRLNGTMPETVTLELTIPPELGDPDEIRALLKRRVAEAEQAFAAERQRTGRRVLGRRGVLRQSWRACAATKREHRGLRPRVAARNVWRRIEALQRSRAFQVAYREARVAWRAGETVTFPYGTYWLRRFAGVAVAPPPQH